MHLSPMLLALALQTAAAPDPMLLPIGAKGTVRVAPEQMVSTRDGNAATPGDVAKAADKHRYVFLAESHDNPKHHQMQADIIKALVDRGRTVVVGMEMFTRPVQKNLAGWTLGVWSDDEFIANSDWKKQWGFDYKLYKPIFAVAKQHRLPVVALNVPRDWVRAVGRGGYAALTPEQKAELPADLDLTNGNHKSIFTALMGGHPMTGTQGDNIYAAQVLWDEGMADTAIKYMQKRSSSTIVFVVVAGSGHVMYEQGINWRIKKRTGEDGITVHMGEADAARPVARGIGEFVYLTAPVQRASGRQS